MARDPAANVPESRELRIRPVRARADYEACVGLQHETWGRSFSETVPWSMMDITAKMSGVVTGAFGPDGTLYGFVYGVTGLRKGELSHWSHMLAVRPDARDRGIGRRLKQAQREELLAVGVKTMYWTFDPLVARNAHLNINVLRVRVDQFVVDMYGDSDSKLHRLGTDRFIVRWDLDGAGRCPAASGPQAAATPDGQGPPDAGGAAGPGDPAPREARDAFEVCVPSDIEAVQARSFDEAVKWRHTTRRALNRLRDGWEIVAFTPGETHGRYVIARAPGPP